MTVIHHEQGKGIASKLLKPMLEYCDRVKTPVYLETTLQAVNDGHIVCKDKDGNEVKIDCDSVISSAGYIPNPLTKAGGNVHLVGDCLQIGNLRTVIWRAYEVAMKI